MQDLLDHITFQIFTIPSIPKKEIGKFNFEVICKWKCNGSSGQAQYKQILSGNIRLYDTYGNILFLYSIVPLQLQCR